MTPVAQRDESSRPRSDGDALQGHGNEVAIRERIDTLAEAIRNKNADQVMAHYTSDVVAYDLQPPLEVRGVAAYRRNFEKWFASMAARISFDVSDVHISASDNEAFSHCLSHVTGPLADGGRADYWVRVTSGWRKLRGQWLVAHEHISMPTMM